MDCLFSDRQRGLSDMVVEKLTYDELIGALLAARDLADNEGRDPGYGGSYD
ncbi:hypothetical protein [Haloferula sp. BvORR071]|uniref:hypothetical protein n=1 Tax=Haloferula sp. BvORR071 TaxID=1396141 RepID=UPI002240EBE8|nr:hypothetical protein [Haloferula sp. BvORR071]